MVLIGHIRCNQECWRGDKHKLKTPETDVGDRKELIIADIFTAGLKNRETQVVTTMTLKNVLATYSITK